MANLVLTLYFHYLFILRLLLNVESVVQTRLPRMTFTQNELALEDVTLPEEILAFLYPQREHSPLMAVGKRHLISLSFQNPFKTTVETKLLWTECADTQVAPNGCNYDVVLAHERKDTSRVFLCGTDGAETLCCDMKPYEFPLICSPTDDLKNMQRNIRDFILKDAEHSTLVESAESSSLFVTYSGSQEYVGVHKFGKNRVGPANLDKEQQYIGLVPIRRKDEPLQDKVYAFYKERNKDLNVCSSIWLPYVSQFCMVDIGGPKNNMQFTWTSQLSAKLFCGDPKGEKRFSEIVDITTVHAEQWQDTLVYALFRNEWNMSAVCMYSMKDIHDIFMNSTFKGSDHQRGRPRVCVPDSTRLSLEVLRMTQINSEMEQWVKPVKNSEPLLVRHHVYTHIRADASFTKEHTLLFLSRNCGGVDKVVLKESTALIVAEYRPFTERAHIDDLILHPFSKNLYVKSGNQLLQMNVANCALYGDTCEQCVLAQDPYCGWDGESCTSITTSSGEVVQDVKSGNYRLCSSSSHVHSSKVVSHPSMPEVALALPHGFQFYLHCPVGSHHANYSWHHNGGGPTPCTWSPHGCLLLIDSQQDEEYMCMSEEKGYRRELARYTVKVTGRGTLATCHTGILFWLCVLAALMCAVM
ncbi:semaphorin-7A-like isoform X1 [Corythoichthys intestinalis]|uniref:semaphorin-7A-like isoform X1 n=2 Tax=Corythoichthys intestinalis TaxID=161448 RepID=UPI0025A4EBA4|nr:semaphorin-7A-like isoform X1 [Corythoichthys intestinalis]